MSGLWTDAQIDAGIDAAWASVAPRFLTTADTTVTVATGDVEIPHADPRDVVRIADADDALIPTLALDRNPARDRAASLAWTPGSTSILLSRAVTAAEAGSWTVTALAIPERPAVVGTAWPLPQAAALAVCTAAAAACLRTRYADDAKRGVATRYTHLRLAADLEAQARDIIAGMRRRVVMR